MTWWSGRGRVLLTRVLAILIWALATYILALSFQYVRRSGDVQRHHLESAAFIFVTMLLCAAAMRWQESQAAERQSHDTSFAFAFAIAAVASLWLYFPSIGSGRFADDFVLLDAARQGRWTVWADLFRPAIFFVWRVLDRFMDDPSPLLHLANIVLHGVNASMVFALGRRVHLTTWCAALAAALFLVFPASVEAVVWPSGFQDVGMTTLVLIVLLIATSHRQSMASAAAASAIATLACVTKETAVTVPVLAGLVVLASATRQWKVVVGVTVAIALFLFVRLSFLPLPEAAGRWFGTSRYLLKESIVRPFASLLVPFRATEVATQPLVVWGLVALVVVSLAVAASRSTKTDDRLRLAVIASVFVLVSIAPLFRFFIVSDDLHGSRYLYLASVAWTILLARLYAGGERRSWRLGQVCALLTLVVWIVAARAHQRPWLAAADDRDRILAALGDVPRDCSRSAVYGLPKVVNGVPIFLNGFAEAARERTRGDAFRFEPSTREGGECRLTWDGTRLLRE
jgi:hypothetical protein